MISLQRLEQWLRRPPAAAVLQACRELRSVLLPVVCVVCGAPDDSLCKDCESTLRQAILHPFEASGGAGLLPERDGPAAGSQAYSQRSASASEAVPEQWQPLSVMAAGRYGTALARVLLACKNHGHTDLSGFLAVAMARALHAAPLAGEIPVLVVPVPGTARARNRRGYDPLQLILGIVRKRGLLPENTRVAPLLRYRRSIPVAGWTRGGSTGQKALGARARRRRVHGTMTAGEPGSLLGVKVLVADDVLTTGATVAEAARALRAAGARVLGAVVIAAARAPAGSR